jgi:uncharacterized protein
MKTSASLCFVLFVCSTLGFAQQPATATAKAAAEKASREDVVKYLDALHVRRTMEQMIDGMKKQMKTGAEAGMKHQLPNATPEQIAKITSMVDDSLSEIKVDELIEVVIPIYQEHISKADLQQVLAFYQSPVGQRLLDEQPAMMQESMQKSSELMQTKLPEIFKKLDERFAKEFPQAKVPPAAPAATKKPATTH